MSAHGPSIRVKAGYERRHHPVDPTTCDLCGDTALYRVAGKGYCKLHYRDARTAATARSVIVDVVNARLVRERRAFAHANDMSKNAGTTCDGVKANRMTKKGWV